MTPEKAFAATEAVINCVCDELGDQLPIGWALHVLFRAAVTAARSAGVSDYALHQQFGAFLESLAKAEAGRAQ